MKAIHKFLGEVEITSECDKLDSMNPDSSSRYVEHEGEIKEVTKSLITNYTCGNPELNFDCVCDWIKKHPGKTMFYCEYCRIYSASKPRCNKCEED